ncbi:hypothetical protein Tco_0565161 [Tanacetum coccineum]
MYDFLLQNLRDVFMDEAFKGNSEFGGYDGVEGRLSRFLGWVYYPNIHQTSATEFLPELYEEDTIVVEVGDHIYVVAIRSMSTHWCVSTCVDPGSCWSTLDLRRHTASVLPLVIRFSDDDSGLRFMIDTGYRFLE